MTGKGQDALPVTNRQQDDGLDDESIPAGAQPICPECLTPCHRLQYYCDNCGSNETINPLASYMPFVRIRFNVGMYGKLWRRIWFDKYTSPILKLFLGFLIALGVLSGLA